MYTKAVLELTIACCIHIEKREKRSSIKEDTQRKPQTIVSSTVLEERRWITWLASSFYRDVADDQGVPVEQVGWRSLGDPPFHRRSRRHDQLHLPRAEDSASIPVATRGRHHRGVDG